MDRRLLRSAPREDERLHRFLRPGALARLRDSRIVARSLRTAAAATRLLPTSLPPVPAPPPPPQPVAGQQGGAPHFLGPARGLGSSARYPLRRRLSAARSVVFLPPSPAATEAFLGAFTPPSPPDFAAPRALGV